MRRSRPETTEANSAENVFLLDSTGWSDQQTNHFKETCAAEMDAFGNTYDETYRACGGGARIAWFFGDARDSGDSSGKEPFLL
jgi:hypothetical protein